MTLKEFFDNAWVTLLLTVLPLYYAYRLLIQEKLEMIRPKGAKAIEKKKRKPYAHDAGMVMLVTGICMGVCSIICFFSPLLSLGVSFIVFGGFVFAWKKTYEKYEK